MLSGWLPPLRTTRLACSARVRSSWSLHGERLLGVLVGSAAVEILRSQRPPEGVEVGAVAARDEALRTQIRAFLAIPQDASRPAGTP